MTSDPPVLRELGHRLEASGHELTQLTAGGEALFAAVEQGARFHAAVLAQAALGKGWPRQLRQLRRRAPYLPAVVLLAPGGEEAWRHAILAGAFEAVPLSSPLEVILEVLGRAVEYAAGKPLLETARPRVISGATEPTSGRSKK